MGLVTWEKEEKPCMKQSKQDEDMVGGRYCHTMREGHVRKCETGTTN